MSYTLLRADYLIKKDGTNVDILIQEYINILSRKNIAVDIKHLICVRRYSENVVKDNSLIPNDCGKKQPFHR